MCKKICLFILFCSGSLRPGFGLPILGSSGEYTPAGKAVHRVSLGTPGARLDVLHTGYAGVPEYARFTLAFPRVDIGSITAGALVREMSNPAGYSIRSGVYSDTAGYRRDTALARGSPLGAVVSLAGDVWSLQIPVLIHPLPGSGCSAGLSLPGGHRAAAVCLVTRTPEPAADDDWFFPAPEVASQKILHGAAGYAADLSFGSLSFAGGLSRPDYLPAGGFVRALAEGHTDVLSAAALLAYCSDTYIGPQGDFPGIQAAYGASAALQPEDHLFFRLEMMRTLHRLELIPDNARKSRDYTSGEMNLAMGDTVWTACLERKVDWESDGSGHLTDTFTMGLDYTAITGRLAGEVRFREIDGGEYKIRAGLEGRYEIGIIRTSAAVGYGEEEGLSGRLTGGLKTDSLRMELSAGIDGTMRWKMSIHR